MEISPILPKKKKKKEIYELLLGLIHTLMSCKFNQNYCTHLFTYPISC